ncbi:MAG TPA: hypothetical protein VFZ59_04210 [Verrucomicrobiae bacterium]|nr:hypothetical protein [Verrucomicrobiae bacterium]
MPPGVLGLAERSGLEKSVPPVREQIANIANLRYVTLSFSHTPLSGRLAACPGVAL